MAHFTYTKKRFNLAFPFSSYINVYTHTNMKLVFSSLIKNFLPLSFLIFLGVTNLLAQTSQNIDFLSNWNGSGEEYSDIWGYADGTGQEYAIIGSQNQTHFINISNPSNPVPINSFTGSANTFWRDFKTYQNYAYGVSEGSGSLQIFDLSGLPNQVTKVFDSTVFFTNCHNIFIDEQHGRLYAVGTSIADVVLLDLTANPASPTLIRNINLQGAYVHDVYVRDHIGYCSHEARGLYVYDFENPNNVVLKGTLTSYTNQGYNHSSWLTADGNTLMMADENHDLAVKVVDVSDLTDIEVTSIFKSTLESPTATNSIAHNPFVIGNKYVAVSYYHDGVQIYDISNPANPVRAAYFDTYTGNSNYNGFTGCWGVYPYLPSGRIIASDILNGLYVLEPTLDCAFNKWLDGTIVEGQYAAVQKIISSGEIITASAVTYTAGETIDLLPGFDTFQGGTFLAEIGDCPPRQDVATFQTPTNPIEATYQNSLVATYQEGPSTIEATPNPTTSWLSVEINIPTRQPAEVRLFAANGQLLQYEKITSVHQTLQYDFSKYGKGMYILQLRTPSESISKKIMVVGE